jgi:ATP-dependent Clp protease ATP-binding subunit ClpB
MVTDDSELFQFLCGKAGVNMKRVEEATDAAIKSLAKVEVGSVYLSQDLSKAAANAEKAMREMGDEFITNEHMILGILEGRDTAANLLKDAGFRRPDLLKAIKELRGGNKVTSETAENQFNAL